MFVTLQTFAQEKITYEYDVLNRLTKVTYPNGAVVTYTYDALGNRTSKKLLGGEWDEIIVFKDETVKSICVVNWDLNGDGELSSKEAAAVTSLGTVFKQKSIDSFDELRYFTGLTQIDDNAFYECICLKSIIIPKNVTSIGNQAFQSCVLTSIDIPNSVTSIGTWAFAGCPIAAVNIPNSVTYIANEAFYGSGLTSITIGNGVTSIGAGTFGYCNNLTSVTFGNNVTRIDNYVFRNCKSLSTITIPGSVTKLGYGVFTGCSNLSTIYSEIQSPFYIEEDVFDVYETATLYVPAGTKSAYMNKWSWSKFFNIVEMDAPLLAGDVNNDGLITVSDVMAQVSILIGKDNGNPPKFNHEAADMNEDGGVTIADVMLLVKFIVEKQ